MSSTDKAFYNSLGDKYNTGIEMEDSSKLNIPEESSWSAKMNVMNSFTQQPDEVFDAVENSKNYRFATNASWAVNWFLLIAKIFASIVSASKAVTAAMVDSVVDILSQGILALSDRYIAKHSPNYPVGRSRLEALSVIACAFIMSMASVEVMQYSAVDLYEGLNGRIPLLDLTTALYVIFVVGIFLKFFLWLYCLKLNVKLKSDTIAALAEDHFNDVLSNTAALITASIAYHTPYWWFDPVGAILISLVIIYRWVDIINEQVKKIVGHTAPPEYIEKVEELAFKHDVRLAVDCTRVYHFGARYNVEMEIVLPGEMTVMENHDIALALQHKIEGLEEVERAFVHVDHEKRDGLEHKIERELVNGASLKEVIEGETTMNPITKNELRSRNTGNNSNNNSNNNVQNDFNI